MRKSTAALALAAILGSVTASTAENGFTAADVLGWAQENQDAYIETSVAMAGVMASKSQGETATCISEWYFGNPAKRQSKNQEIRAVMNEYQTYHPGIVIVAVLERQCGSLSFSK